MNFSPRLQQLLNALRCLPGVGPKSAQRIAFHLLDRDRDGAQALADALGASLEHVRNCDNCRMLAEAPLCIYCSSDKRDRARLCVVESPADVIAVEDSGGYRGLYFVLMGRLSPLDGVGAEELGVKLLEQRLGSGEITEVVLATSATVEGEATAAFLAGLASRHGVAATRIAHGVPMGGELEYVDSNTLSLAIATRTTIVGD